MPIDRRTLILSGALAAGASEAIAQSSAPPHRARRRRAIVLVHDSWHGGWCWRHVAQRLRTAGHQVYTPTLTGLGERAHLRSPAIALSTHIADVLGVLDCEELEDVVVVGHGYAGIVLAGVADRRADKLSHIVFIDGIIPKAGASMWDILPAELSDRQSRDLIDGYLVRPPQPSVLGVAESDVPETQWLGRRLTPHPAACFTERLVVKNGGISTLPRIYLDCTKQSIYGPQNPFAQVARNEPGWTVQTIDSGHDAMLTAPDALSHAILEIA